MRKLIFGGGLALALLLLGGYLSYQYFNGSDRTRQEVESTVVLERLQRVCQLVTVKGSYSEIYHERNLREVTLYLPIPTYWEFSKEALLKVQGTVLVGYDMEAATFTADATKRQIRISNLPAASILAVEHDIEYINLEESFFNSFSPTDYTQLNKNAKAILLREAQNAKLLEEAKAQRDELLQALELLARGMGWELIVAEQHEAAPLN
ncbi:MAG: DUF4230 domain-containing protein [Bacteroidota bacterium]